MAVILEFRRSSALRQRRTPRRMAELGEIVLFPGVRYERWADSGPASHGETVGSLAREIKVAE
jgi:hypothetical protein